MINTLCHRGNLLLKLARTLSKSEIFLRPRFLKKPTNQTPHYCSLQFWRLNNLLLSIKILNNAMNHTKLNFGKLVPSTKETEKNCVIYQKHLLKQQNVKRNRIDAVFSVKRLCLILLNMYSLFLCIFVCASPLKQQ